jgi:hypothetical protein
MNKTYVIHWKSKVNGRTGTGTSFFNRAEAEGLAAELNRDYPDIEHEARNTAPPDEVDEPVSPLLAAELSSF